MMAAMERLREQGLEPGNGRLEWLELDLEAPGKIKTIATGFSERESRLDVLGESATTDLSRAWRPLTFCQCIMLDGMWSHYSARTCEPHSDAMRSMRAPYMIGEGGTSGCKISV